VLVDRHLFCLPCMRLYVSSSGGTTAGRGSVDSASNHSRDTAGRCCRRTARVVQSGATESIGCT